MPEADRQDTGAIYKKLTLKELQSVTPTFDWNAYLNTFMPIKIEPEEPVVVYAFSYLIETIKIMHNTDARVIHNYAIWRLVRQLCAYLGN
jgi:membrane metallo-endopeptidase-like protein 1